MDLSSYHAFTDSLVASLTARDDVLGLVAVGSMAGGPDEFSDHDFFVIAAPGDTDGLRTDVTWLPRPDRLVLVFRETEHGVKAVYDNGHVVELAVFTPDELALARVNRYEVLIDGGNLRDRMASAARASADAAGSPEESDAWLVGQLLTALLVGVQRHRRGEKLSAVDFVHRAALRHFLVLLARHVPAEDPGARDDLNPFRRVERAWPAVGLALSALLATGNLERTALGLLDLASDLFRPHLTDAASPDAAWAAVRGYLTTR
jgi:hypothetical protein